MANTFDATYVEQHRQKIHNYESLGRSIAELLLRTAEEQLKKTGPQNGPVAFNANVSVAPIAPPAGGAQNAMLSLGCVSVQICTPLGCVSGHVGV